MPRKKDVTGKKNIEKNSRSEPILYLSEIELKKRNRKNYIILLSLILIWIILWDLIFIFAYLKPNLSSIGSFFSFKSANIISENACSDGTPLNACSSHKPLFCYEKELVKKSSLCGCPNGYVVDFQDCKKA